MTNSMWTTGIAPLCSSGFVTDKIVLDRVMPRFGLCCTVFALELSSFSELVGVTDLKQFLLLLLSLPTGIAIYSCLPIICYSIPHILLPLFLQIIVSGQRQGMFPCLLCISFHSDVCSDLYIYLECIQMYLSLSFSGCECCERIRTQFQ